MSGMTNHQARMALRQTIEQSGLSASRWARQVAKVTDRTVRHWLKGSRPIPQRIQAQLQPYQQEHRDS